ncbi:MAG: hypothetical protein CL944_01635 [Candidatus Diapherotrites archaeon]|uniref:Uncharacterized protein n=1 Tax=Candidatus Iainarchaeum sp. TaxID=3101447 RepID=A0A2D6LPW2_9ARCH|nr:hypothetical protein [Candidatus Diapherotrites archaeon]|tara:strand:- start:12187 stop:12486 length:300 start_codon:yes stop_codon:yes gene_type:complete
MPPRKPRPIIGRTHKVGTNQRLILESVLKEPKTVNQILDYLWKNGKQVIESDVRMTIRKLIKEKTLDKNSILPGTRERSSVTKARNKYRGLRPKKNKLN